MQKCVLYFKEWHADNTQNPAPLGDSLMKQAPEFLQDLSDLYVSHSNPFYFFFFFNFILFLNFT